MNVQVIADPKGRRLWASPAPPGAVHDVRAARDHGIVDALTQAGLACWADRGDQGARGRVRVPYPGRWETPSAGRQAVNRSHTKIRALVEQAVATLKAWRILRKARCLTTKMIRRVVSWCPLPWAKKGDRAGMSSVCVAADRSAACLMTLMVMSESISSCGVCSVTGWSATWSVS